MEKTIDNPKTNHYGEEKREQDRLGVSEKFGIEDLLLIKL